MIVLQIGSSPKYHR